MSTTVKQQGSMSRAQKIANAQELRAQGVVFREIAAQMGVAISTVGGWLNDPDGSRLRARKNSYAGSCVDCGAPTNGSNGKERAPTRCLNCSVRFRHETAKWTRVTILQSIREFATRYGRSPAAADFSPTLARQLGHSGRVTRFYADGCYPHATQVQSVFGSWNAAIKAAGLIPTETGHYDRHRAQSERAMQIQRKVEALWAEGLTARQIGQALGRTREANISKLRARGYNLPHRYPPERIAKARQQRRR